jgi:hypothetical protein
MVWRPDSQITMWNPTACQIDMNMMAGIAAVGLFSQSVPWTTLKLSVWSMLLTSPSGWYMKRHRMDTTTIEVTTGTKYIVRKKLTPRILALISSASSRANADCRGTTTTAK